MAMNITAAEVAHRLGGARQGGEGWYCRCPAHEDRKPSLWINDRAGGGLIVKCHAGCAEQNVREKLKAMRLWPEPGYRKKDDPDAKRRRRLAEEVECVISPVPDGIAAPEWEKLGGNAPTRLYEYRDTNGRLSSYVARWDRVDGKEIFPVSLVRFKDGSTGWAFKKPPGPQPLYNLPELLARTDAMVLVVEGEKAADAAKRTFPQFVTVAWMGGANAVGKTDLTPLRGRTIITFPDADEAGIKAMAALASLAYRAGAAEVRQVVLPSDLPKGWDVADHIPPGVALDFKQLFQDAPRVGAEGEVADSTNTPSIQGLRPFVLSAAELMNREVPKRELIVDPFLPVSSLAMIYGARGGGKTWISLSLATAVALGEKFLAFEVDRPRVVLFVDGEMAFAELQERIRLLSPAPPGNLFILPSELLFREATPLNLHNPEHQDAIEKVIADLEVEGMRPEVVIFDNLSSLSGGVDENDNSALDALLRWLIKLRHMGLAIVLVHHAGKNGAQRGASRREDLLDTSIALLSPPEEATPHDGAHLVLTFAKARGRRPKPDELELKLTQYEDRLVWACSEVVEVDRATEMLRIIWEKRPETQAALAALAGVKPAAVSHQMKKLRREGHLGEGELTVTPAGLQRLIDVWPELEAAMLKQGELPLGRII